MTFRLVLRKHAAVKLISDIFESLRSKKNTNGASKYCERLIKNLTNSTGKVCQLI